MLSREVIFLLLERPMVYRMEFLILLLMESLMGHPMGHLMELLMETLMDCSMDKTIRECGIERINLGSLSSQC